MFCELIDIVQNKVNEVCKTASGLPEPQLTVLLTDDGSIYLAVNDVDGTICEELKRNKNTKIVRMVTMWKGGGIDLPSISFRKALIEMDEHNINTEIILQGKDGHLIKKLSVTMP